MANLTIRDAFKALEDVEDIIEVKPVIKERKRRVVNESVDPHPEFLKKQTAHKEVYDQKILDDMSNLSAAPEASSEEQSSQIINSKSEIV